MEILYIPRSSGHHLTYARHFQDFANRSLLICSPNENVLQLFSDRGFTVKLIPTINENIPDLSPYFGEGTRVKVYYSYMSSFKDILNLFKLSYSSRSLFFMSFLGQGGTTTNIKQVVKYLLLSILLFVNRKVEIFFLEDERAVRIFRTIINKNRIGLCLDPVDRINDSYKKTITIGHFGTLCKRKGSDLFIQLSKMYSENSSLNFLMAGKVIDINDILDQSFNISLKEGFISDKQLELYITQADIIVLPYREKRGSSGMLINALAHRKIVIGPYSGLIGKIGRQSIYYIPVKGESVTSYNLALQKTVQSLQIDIQRNPQRFVTEFLQ